jgi:hypothetical protein
LFSKEHLRELKYDPYFEHNQHGGSPHNAHLKVDEMGGACSRKKEKRNAYRILVEKPEG